MRKMTHTESVDLLGYTCSSIDTRTECDRQAGRSAHEGLIDKLNTAHIQGMLRIVNHGARRAYTSTLMVGTEDEYKQALSDAERFGVRYGTAVGTQQGLDVGRLEGHRSGKHAAEADFRRMPLWRKVYHHFAGF